MAVAMQSKRVSWAPGVKLCQVRLFLSEDAPSQSGLGAQDNLQAKASWLLHAEAIGSDDSPPPGFEAPQYCFKKQTSPIPLIKWQSPPPAIILNPEWLVVAGEESEEVSVQYKRQLGVFEALHPRLSSIPPDPFDSLDAHGPHHDDHRTPLIPISTIEEEEEYDSPEQSGSVETPSGLHFRVEAEKAVADAEPDVVAAASAAFTAIMRSSEEGSLIDRDLLISILSNPSLLEKLVSEYDSSKQTPPLPVGINLTTAVPASQTVRMYPFPNVADGNRIPAPAANWIPAPPPVKDANYYKSLIQQHGEERQGDLKDFQFPESLAEMKGVDGSMKVRIPKPCLYFNSPRGCRHGERCMYRHDARMDEPPRGTKRIRLDRGIAGRN